MARVVTEVVVGGGPIDLAPEVMEAGWEKNLSQELDSELQDSNDQGQS